MISWVSAEGIGTGTLRHSFHEPSLAQPKPWSQSEVHVRAYEPGDRRAIRKICCDTGFLGQPIDTVFQDRELFADLFTGPYLNHEPEWAFVAEAGGKVVGYLLGSTRKDFDFVLMRNGFPIASKMVYKLLTGKYTRHPRSARFVRWLVTSGYHEQPKHPPGAAHLHLDIVGAYRGRGVGRHLWASFEKRLKSAGVKSCYGAFFSHPGRRPESVYSRYGFSDFDRTRTTLFQPEIPDVEVVCVHKDV
jgi:ribosomal protein S18 acetylase RimI-like enzyme